MWGFTILFIVLLFSAIGLLLLEHFKDSFVSGILGAILIPIIILLGIVCLARPYDVEQQVTKFEAEQQMINYVCKNATPIDRAQLTSKVIEMNSEILEAQLSYTYYGIFSYYYDSDIMNVKLLNIPK